MTTTLENHFEKFRKGIVGNNLLHKFPFGKMPVVYADWTASGRLYQPIEDYITRELGPYVADQRKGYQLITEKGATG